MDTSITRKKRIITVLLSQSNPLNNQTNIRDVKKNKGKVRMWYF